LQAIAVVRTHSGDNLVRKRRTWIPPPKNLTENEDYSQINVAKIHSDFDDGTGNIQYSLEGVGANQYPFHVFVVDPKTGQIRVTKVLDREFIDMYNLSGVATFSDGREAERKIYIRFRVVDENDNSPVFGVMKPGVVDELSPIAYSIVNQNPSDDMFYMNNDGIIYVKRPFLDREKADQYTLTVKGQDLNGDPRGNSATTTVTINVRDVNDNLPTLEKEEYEGSIEENTEGVEVMRIKAEDLDLEGTDNWEAVFDIVKGNEAGYFSITTDPKTNEGILMLDKAVDYEDVKDLELGLAVRNKAPPLDGSGAVKAIPISEGGHSVNIKDVIGHYPAIDGDTGKPAENVRYAKGSDPDNWLTIDPKTADIKLNKIPDRESPFLVNGTYMAKVLCISEDMPGKTSTGTVAIQVEDFNDHCPKLTSGIQTMCTTDNAVIVNAKDEDAFPNGPPFHFSIVSEGTEGKWHVEHLNGGFTEMPFDTKSHLINYRTEGQGENTEVPLLNMPIQMDGDMINVDMGMASKTLAMNSMAGLGLQKSVTSMDGMNGATYGEGFVSDHREGTWGMNQLSGSGFYSEFEGRESGGGGLYDCMALPDHFLAQYYTQKVSNGNENPGVKDALLVYDYEGQGSSAGSVGCCSLLESDNDLQFLNDLGPKFKTLAEVCGGKMILTEVKQGFTPLPSASINTQISESNLVTGPQLPLAPQLQPTVPKMEQSTVVREKTERSQIVKESTAMVRGEMANQGQMLLLQQQQPVYYTTSPVMQPMHYIVQPQVQNTMLLAEAPATNLQGMVLVNGTQTVPAQGMVVHGQTVMSRGQSQGPSMVLVERSGIQGCSTNLINTGNLSSSQTMMIAEGKVPAGSVEVLKGSQTCFVQGGTLQAGGLSGSQRVLVVGGSTSNGGQLVQAGGLSKKSDVSGAQRVLYRKGSMSTGPQSSVLASSTTMVSTTPTYHKGQETREIE
ncbi:desmoglein-2-like protein, partial [Lates japonicus]